MSSMKTSKLDLETSADRDSTTSLGSMFQRFFSQLKIWCMPLLDFSGFSFQSLVFVLPFSSRSNGTPG